LVIVFREPADELRLQQSARQAREAQPRDRYRVALLAAQGLATQAIIDATGRSRGFVQRWAYAYRDGGVEALCAKPRGGSKSRLSGDEQQRLYQRLCDGPADADGGVCALRGRDAKRILEVEFDRKYTLGGVYDLVHRIGLSCLRPRPRHRKNDPAAMKQWLDDAPLFCDASRPIIPTKPSKSGPRTKPASDNRGH